METKTDHGLKRGLFKRKDVQMCVGCGKGVAHDRNIIFFRVQVERFGLDQQGIMQTAGLEQFFGGGQPGAVLANVMGTNPDLAVRVGEPWTKLICLTCSIDAKGLALMPLLYPDDEKNHAEEKVDGDQDK